MSRLIDADVLLEHIKKLECHAENKKYEQGMNDFLQCYFPQIIDNQPTAFDTEKVVEQLNNVLQDLNVIEVIDHIVFDSTIQTSLENFLNAFKSEIMRIVKNNACIDELLKGEEG